MSEKKKHPGGRPRKFESPEQFDELADKYFEDCKAEGLPITWTGLCLGVGVCQRSSLEPYKEGKYDTDEQKFSYSIKKALMRVELEYEKRLVNDGGSGPIFALKNFGWKDKQEMDVITKDVTLVPPNKPEEE